MRIIVWLGLAVLVYFAIRKNMNASRTSAKKEETRFSTEDGSSFSAARSVHQTTQSEAMLNCAQCQIYFPASEAVLRGNLQFCCKEHAEAFSQ
ncbi:PP0621 family protein [Undibacterium fentianense]|uniref:PP0621 family protein n=1 Tax=Undibacterium fentianense TaxID=2828728 RepID=UPI0034DD7DAF